MKYFLPALHKNRMEVNNLKSEFVPLKTADIFKVSIQKLTFLDSRVHPGLPLYGQAIRCP